MVVCKFSVIVNTAHPNSSINVCALANRIKCDGMDDDMENCPLWNHAIKNVKK
jgi:hypothetical protein